MPKRVLLNEIKRGESFYYLAKWEGALASELRSQVKTKDGKFIAEMVIEPTSEPDTFRFSVDDTSEWPIGSLQTDIKRTVDGLVKYTDTTMIIPVGKAVTD